MTWASEAAADKLSTTLVAVGADDRPAPAAGRRVEIPVVYDGAGSRRGGATRATLAARRWSRGIPRARIRRRRSSGSRPDSPTCSAATSCSTCRGARAAQTGPRRSVAIAGPYSGVYPRDTPGGWRLLGRTYGDPVRRGAAPARTPRDRRPRAGSSGMNELEVVRAGPLTTFQDRGRPGFAHLGVPPSGAADPLAFELANRSSATTGRSRARGDTRRPDVAVCRRRGRGGHRGRGGRDDLGSRARARNARARGGRRGARAGRLSRRRPRLHLRPAASPSRRRSAAARTTPDGPRAAAPSRRGPAAGRAGTSAATAAPVTARGHGGEPTLTVIPGPRDDWFPSEALAALVGAPGASAATSNRIGIRLEGRSLPRRDRGELLSEGLVTGSIQVTSAGQPILLGSRPSDHRRLPRDRGRRRARPGTRRAARAWCERALRPRSTS